MGLLFGIFTMSILNGSNEALSQISTPPSLSTTVTMATTTITTPSTSHISSSGTTTTTTNVSISTTPPLSTTMATSTPVITTSTITTSTITDGITTLSEQKKRTVLIMNTKAETNVPLITDLDGRSSRANFRYGVNTEVNKSCLVLFNGIAYIFGGSNKKRQISRVENCQLNRVASLDFDFKNGACASTTSGTIYLCFRDKTSGKSCHIGNDPMGRFDETIAKSNFEHFYIRLGVGPGESSNAYGCLLLTKFCL